MLDPRSNVTYEELRQLRGLPVCVIMNDGSRHIGLLTGCSKTKIVLNGDPDDEASAPALAGRAGAKGRAGRGGKKKPARKSATRPQDSLSAGEPDGPFPDAGGWNPLALGPLEPAGQMAPAFGPRVELPVGPIEAVFVI